MDHAAFSAIAHTGMRYCNPLSVATMEAALESLDLPRGARALDVGCGKGEWLIRLAERYGAHGAGIDLAASFLAEGRDEAVQRLPGPHGGAVEFREGSARELDERERYDVVSCFGASHIFDGLDGTLRALAPLVRPGGWLLIGEGYWKRDPDDAYLARLGASRDELRSHAATVAAGEAAGLVPSYAWTTTRREFDDYEWTYVRNAEEWAAAHRDHPDHDDVRRRARVIRDHALLGGREFMGFGLYLFRQP